MKALRVNLEEVFQDFVAKLPDMLKILL